MNRDEKLSEPRRWRAPRHTQILVVRVLILACLIPLLATLAALTAPHDLARSAEVSGDATVMALVSTGAGLRPPLDVHAQLIAYGADHQTPRTKGPKEFFQEILDLVLKVLALVGFVATILAAVTLWLDQRAAARRREDLRICPKCYRLVRRREADRCLYCQAELTPKVRVATSPPRIIPAHYDAPPERPVRRIQIKRPADPEFMREEGELPAVEERAREEPVLHELVPVKDERLHERPREREDQDWEQEEWERDEWEREVHARRRKELIYAYVSAIFLGYIAVALLIMFGRL